MNKIFYILFLLLLFSCSRNKNEQLYIGYIEQFELLTALNDSISQKRINYYSDLMNDLRNNPRKFQPWFNKVNIVKTKSDSLINEIEDIKKRILSDQNASKIDLEGINNSRSRISKDEQNQL